MSVKSVHRIKEDETFYTCRQGRARAGGCGGAGGGEELAAVGDGTHLSSLCLFVRLFFRHSVEGKRKETS